MTPDQLRKIAFESSRGEFELICKKMEVAAKAGGLSCDFDDISDGAKAQLEAAGYIITRKSTHIKGAFNMPTKYYYQVSFA